MNELVERSAYPINSFKDTIIDWAEKYDVFAICAPTGSGKSTQVPQILHEIGYRNIRITVPTRTAASTISTYVANQMGSPIGETVGFKTGYEKMFSDKTEIIYITEASELMHEFYDNEINFENTVVILDEIQEPSIPNEALMAWFKKKITEGHHVKLILMSANMEIDRISEFFGTIPVLNVPGKLYEITEYQKRSCDLIPTIAELVELQRNVLVFADGKQTIEQIIQNLKKVNLNANILRLHADLPLAEQQRVFIEPTLPTVVVATNVAQTSITIPYIDAVVDSGFEKRMQTIDDIDTLAVGVISKSDYIQRRGRAGRTKPGIYVWCNDTPLHKLQEYPTPDIYTGSIHQIILQLATINIDATEIEFLHQPPMEKIKATQKTLRVLGAFDENNKVTECGEIMAKLPVSVRHSRMIVEGYRRDVLSDMITIAAIAEFGGIIDSNSRKEDPAKLPNRVKEAIKKANKNSTLSHYNFDEMKKCELLFELMCFETIKEELNNASDSFFSVLSDSDFNNIKSEKNIFDGIIERNYYRVRELRLKLSDIADKIFKDVSSSHDCSQIIKSCASGLVEFPYVRESNGWYSNPDDPFKRKLDRNTTIFPSKLLLGLPKNISWRLKGNNENQILYLISSGVMVDIPFLKDVAPHLIHFETKNEFIYETNEYLIRDVTFFGSLEIECVERKQKDTDEKREALAGWLAELTLDETYYMKYTINKSLARVIEQNHNQFNTLEEAKAFYSERLYNFAKNSLPNLKKCKSISFLLH